MGPTTGALALAALVALIAFGLWSRLRRSMSAADRLRVDHDELRERYRELAERERKASELAENRGSDLQTLKKDLGAQRKKNFSLAEELKSARGELKHHEVRASEAKTKKPAFAYTSEPKPDPTKNTEDTSADELRVARQHADGLAREIEVLKGKLSQASQDQKALHTEEKKLRGDLRRARRRVEDYRRADLIARSRSELADEKLRHLGRRYYDAVSELAALKGEVAPPPSRELEDLRRDAAQVEEALVRSTMTKRRAPSDDQPMHGGAETEIVAPTTEQ